MAHTAMLTRGRSLSSGSTIGRSLSARSRTPALLMAYSHQVWDASNSLEQPADQIVGSGSLNAHTPEQGLLAAATVDVKHPTESFFGIRDSIQSRKPGHP
jgi:hypothetical protein